MAKTVSSKVKLEKEREKAEKAKQKEQLAAEKERVKQQKDAEKAQAAAVKAAKAAERARIEAERDKLRREKEEVRMERERLQVEREKERMAREKEKTEKEKEKSGKEKAKKEKEQEKERLVDRSRNLLSAFLGVTHKPAANDTQPAVAAAGAATAQTSTDSAAADSSSCTTTALPSSTATSSSTSAPPTMATAPQSTPPQPLFHPFQLKPNSSLAPLHRLPPASTDEINYMTQQHSPSSTYSDYPSLASPTSASSANIHATYMRDGASVIERRKRRRSVFYSRPSRRNKLIQHHRTFRPPFYGYLPTLPARALSASRPFGLQSTGINYEVDSDEEWGEEPEGEELGEDEEDEEEGDAGKDLSRGQLRRDGYEEDGDFTVPEDEDEALLMGGLMAEARVMEKGGKKRIVIRPIIVGPWHVGDAITAEVAELRRRTQWKWCRPLTRDVVKRVREVEEERLDRAETSKAHKPKDGAVTTEAASASSAKGRTAMEECEASKVDAQPPHSEQQVEQRLQQQAAGDCFTPPVKKKARRTIVPQLTSTPHSTPTVPHLASAFTVSALDQSLSPTPENQRLDAGACAVDDKRLVGESVAMVSEVAMDVIDADAGHGASGSELEVSELELTTELSCSEMGTCSEMLTSELSTAAAD